MAKIEGPEPVGYVDHIEPVNHVDLVPTDEGWATDAPAPDAAELIHDLKVELARQWQRNHNGSCDNTKDFVQHEPCHWPPPALLSWQDVLDLLDDDY